MLSTSKLTYYDLQDFDGIFFGTENSYDEGTPFVTTCPIGPNATYTYEVPLINDQVRIPQECFMPNILLSFVFFPERLEPSGITLS